MAGALFALVKHSKPVRRAERGLILGREMAAEDLVMLVVEEVLALVPGSTVWEALHIEIVMRPAALRMDLAQSEVLSLAEGEELRRLVEESAQMAQGHID